MPVIVRRQNPPLQSRYQGYKPFLRIDFAYKCAYCRIHEAHWGSQRNFAVEHFRPKSNPEFQSLTLTYSNLYYACNRCNDFKGSVWPSSQQEASGYGFCDPCREDFYSIHVKQNFDGSLEPLTKVGQYTRDHLRLNRKMLMKCRADKRKLLDEIRSARRRLRKLEQKCLEQEDPGIKSELEDFGRELRERLKEFHSFFRPAVPVED